MTELEFGDIGEESGYIQKDNTGIGATYEGFEGVGIRWGHSIASKSTPVKHLRGFATFETADSLPTRAIIEKVEYEMNWLSNTSSFGYPATWKQEFYIGQNIIQGNLPTNENAIYNSANWKECLETTGIISSNTTVDLGQIGIDNFNQTNNTDVMINDSSDYGAGNGQGWNTVLRNSKLIVTYRVGKLYNCKIYNAKIYTE